MQLTQENRKKIRDFVKEYSDSLTRVEAERDHQKAIIDATSAAVGIEKKLLKELAVVHHKQTFSTVQTHQEEFQELFTEVVLR